MTESEEKRKARKKRGKKAKWWASVLTFVGLSSLFGIHGLFGLLLCGAISSAVGGIVGTMAEGLDTTTHNKEDIAREANRIAEEKTRQAVEAARKAAEEAARKAAEPETLPLSGDPEADAVITKGQDMLRQIRAANNAIPDAALTNQMAQLEYLCTQIFKTIAEKPAKAPQIRKFMNYYLPTTLKMLGNYRVMQDRGVSTEDLVQARATLIRGMNMVLTACQKQLDNLFHDDMLDVTTDIDVLEQMLKRDGFMDGGLANVKPGPAATAKPQAAAKPHQAAQPDPAVPDMTSAARYGVREEVPTLDTPAANARTAAAATMGSGVVPTLDVGGDAPQEEHFDSFYQQKRQ